MGNNFKKQLAGELEKVLSEVFEHSVLIKCEYTGNGLLCDFDLPKPITPDVFKLIEAKMREREIPCSYELSGFSGAYLNGDASQKMLQRIHVTAFESEEELAAFKAYMQAASEHDHKKLGSQLKMFSSSEDIGAGLILWHPKGAMLRYLLENFGQRAHILNGYQWVYSPHIGRADLWKTSGHLSFYRDSMYAPLRIDEEEYYLKPMNCPFHINIYKSEVRSYRDLPIRYAEYGTVYRYELSGTLSGLTRDRGFTQDDAHIFCTPDQVEYEVARALKFSLYILRSFGLNEFTAYLSTKPKTKFIGDDDDWSMATEVLRKAVIGEGLRYEIDEGGGAFYGPKIDIKLRDVLNREWQCSTIQFDFNLPERFGITYTGPDGMPHTPYMIHRALFGSIERFAALLIEHYKGNFPLWFAPVQAAIVPIKTAHNDYCRGIETELKRKGFRVVCEYADMHMREKIKRFETEKIPLILVVGDKEIDKNGFSLRSREKGNLGFMTLPQLYEMVAPDLEKGEPRYIFSD